MNARSLLYLTTAMLLVAIGVILGQSLPRYLWSTDEPAQAAEQAPQIIYRESAPQTVYDYYYEESRRQQMRQDDLLQSQLSNLERRLRDEIEQAARGY